MDWKGFDRDYPRRIVTLPGYPFERKRFWFENRRRSTTTDQSLAARWPAVVAAGSRQAEQVPIDLNLHTYAAKYEALDRLSTAYIIARSIPGAPLPWRARRLRPDDLVSRLGVRPIYLRPHGHWLRRLAAVGLLRVQDGLYIADRPLPGRSPNGSSRQVRGLFADAVGLLRWVEGSGPLLDRSSPARRARWTSLPRGLLRPGRRAVPPRAVSRYFNGIVRAAVEAFAAGTPPGRPPADPRGRGGHGRHDGLDPAGLARRAGRVPLHGCFRLLPGPRQEAIADFPFVSLWPA